jgi:hypothetical protein
LLGC